MKRATPRRFSIGTFLLGAVTALLTFKLFSPVLRLVSGEDTSERAGRGRPTSPPSAQAAAAGYETHDANARALFATLGIFAASTAVAIGLMILLLGHWHRADARQEAGYTAAQRMRTPPPEPRLQADPLRDLALARRRADASLLGYARIDANTAHIPITRAMTLLAGRPLDTAAQARP